MILGIPSDAALWEVVGAIQVCQSAGIADVEYNGGDESSQFLELTGLKQAESGTAEKWLDLGSAMRQLEKAKVTYPDLLADTVGLKIGGGKAPLFPGLETAQGEAGGIVVSPYHVHDSFRLPWQIWRGLIKHLRTYGLPVHLLGMTGERADYANFTEGTVLSSLPVADKLRALAQAKLVVGVPNAWTWAAAGYGKKVIVLHPDGIPHERWFGFEVQPRTLGRLLYDAQQLQPAVILAGMRKLISIM